MNDQEDCSGFRIGQVGALGSEMRRPWQLHKGTCPRRTGGRRQTPGTVRRPHRSGQLGLGKEVGSLVHGELGPQGAFGASPHPDKC